jgi:thioredoxin
MKTYVSVLVFCLSFTLNGCANGQGVNTDVFEKGLSNGAQILDVRTPEEYKTGHLPNSMLADINDEEAEFNRRIDALNKEQPVYVYCRSGARSERAAGILKEKGFSQVIELDGGIVAWKKAGKPIEGNPNTAAISKTEYGRMINGSSLVLVDFGAPWCAPCRKMAPVVKQLEKEYTGKLTLVKIDGTSQADLMKSEGVENMPTFIMYQSGKEVWRGSGIIEKAVFDKTLAEFLPK